MTDCHTGGDNSSGLRQGYEVTVTIPMHWNSTTGVAGYVCP